MANKDISDVLGKLYYNLVNEIDNQLAGALDGNSSKLADAVKAAVKDVHNEYCDPADRIG